MSLWKDKFIAPNEFSRPQKKMTEVRKIVIHWTANYGASAMNHFNYFNTLKGRYASAHFFVDSKEALCIIPLNEIAYHANDGSYKGVPELKPNANFLSVGIEMCVEKDGTFHPDTIKRTEDIAVELCKRYKLDPLKDIVRHYDVTHKNCPAPWVANSTKFTNFKNSVNSKLNPKSTHIGVLTVLVDELPVREEPSPTATKVKTIKKGERYKVYKKVDGMYHLGGNQYCSANRNNVEFEPIK